MFSQRCHKIKVESFKIIISGPEERHHDLIIIANLCHHNLKLRKAFFTECFS